MDREALDRITLAIIQAAIEVHRILGPGLLESLYRECLVFELRERGLKAVVVELKAIEAVLPVHCAQVLTYLRLTEKRVGLLMNFNVSYLRQGVRRIVNDF